MCSTMSLLVNATKVLIDTLVEALFPRTTEETELRALSPELAVALLPQAPTYGMTVAALPGTRSVFAYKDPRIARLVKLVKERRDMHALSIAGHALATVINRELTCNDGCPLILIPIPITARRRRERGFNQCELMAEAVVKAMTTKSGGVNDGVKVAVKYNLLTRARSGLSAQKLKNRDERLDDVGGIFQIGDEASVSDWCAQNLNSKTIVIDDVLTTGSTMKAAIDVLHAAGFTDVRGLTLAH